MVIISFILDIIKFYLKWFQELKKKYKIPLSCYRMYSPKISQDKAIALSARDTIISTCNVNLIYVRQDTIYQHKQENNLNIIIIRIGNLLGHRQLQRKLSNP